MKANTKEWIIATITSVIFVIALNIAVNIAESNSTQSTFTKALYNGTHLIDYYFECNSDGSFIAEPTNNTLYVGEGWIDPRPDEFKYKRCGE